MRWKKIIKKFPKIGDTRVISYFALLLVEIDKEVRWLEKVTVKQIRAYKYYGPCGQYGPHWKNIKFIDEEVK